jgi:hypothetical protein
LSTTIELSPQGIMEHHLITKTVTRVDVRDATQTNHPELVLMNAFVSMLKKMLSYLEGEQKLTEVLAT